MEQIAGAAVVSKLVEESLEQQASVVAQQPNLVPFFAGFGISVQKLLCRSAPQGRQEGFASSLLLYFLFLRIIPVMSNTAGILCPRCQVRLQQGRNKLRLNQSIAFDVGITYAVSRCLQIAGVSSSPAHPLTPHHHRQAAE